MFRYYINTILLRASNIFCYIILSIYYIYNGKKKKVYIAGPMTNYKNWNYEEFNRVACELRSRGFIVKNPADIPNARERSRSYCMKNAIQMLLSCEYIYLLEGWEKSNGAKLENEIAKECGIKRLEIELIKTSKS